MGENEVERGSGAAAWARASDHFSWQPSGIPLIPPSFPCPPPSYPTGAPPPPHTHTPRYPTGGDNTSVTSGVVSRVEVAQYVHAASHLMAIQIDAAINPGNSGESGVGGGGGAAGHRQGGIQGRGCEMKLVGCR